MAIPEMSFGKLCISTGSKFMLRNVNKTNGRHDTMQLLENYNFSDDVL